MTSTDELNNKTNLQKLITELRHKTTESVDKLITGTETNLKKFLATELFLSKRKFVESAADAYLESVSAGERIAEKTQAEQDLVLWQSRSGKAQNYTAIELATARLRQKMINKACESYSLELELLNAMHQAYISVAIRQELGAKMIEEGKLGKKFGLIELTSRLGPALTFVDSSNYFHIAAVPYGKESRIVLGEIKQKEFVSASVAKESCVNLLRTFKVDYGVAETSAAPRTEVAKSKRKPEIFICSVKNDKNGPVFFESHHTIDTPFREEFNAVSRELLFYELARLYR